MKLTGTQTVETHRLILRRFRIEDTHDMFENWASDPEVTRYLTWPTHRDMTVTNAVLSDWIPRYGDGDYFNWAIEERTSSRTIGNISVVYLDTETESAEIGYCLSRAFWGRGIMPEALRAVSDYLFDTVGLKRVFARHDVRNLKSGRVMEKAGMKAEGCLRNAGKNNSGICDIVIRAVMRDDREAGVQREHMNWNVRFVQASDLENVNALRREVNDLHVEGRPDIFKAGFGPELRDYVYQIYADPDKKIIVAERNGVICGFAVLNHIRKPDSPFMNAREFLDVDEFGVGKDFRRQGAASAMIEFIRDYAKNCGVTRLELNMWEFNRNALAFYEVSGFTTYRRYMEMQI